MKDCAFGSLALICGVAAGLSAGSVQGQLLTSIRVASGLDRPLYLVSPPGDGERLFVVEQNGKIKIIKNGDLLPTPFISISVNRNGHERGLLGLAFHPKYGDNGFFYVNYSHPEDGDTVIARYKVSDNDPDIADPNSAMQLLAVDQPYRNHNGGWIDFGPDGYLYVGMGDGGGSGDPEDRGQNKKILLGKMLRIDVNGDDFPQDPKRNYAIPPDNPFVKDPDGADEVWAYGLRNPWRNGFDRKTGDLYMGDVGQKTREEIDFQPGSSKGGENYGWRCMEGNLCFQQSKGCVCNDPDLSDPIHEFDHEQGNVVIGGYVYRGSAVPALGGAYFFASFRPARIWSFRYDGKEVTEFTERTEELQPRGGFEINSITSLGEDDNGELYICDLDGEVFKIISNTPPCEDIEKLRARCNRRSKVKVKVKLSNADHDGKLVTIGIGDDLFNVEVKGKKAKLAQCCYNGATVVRLIDPGDCKTLRKIDCP